MSINIILNSVILIIVWNGLVSSIHPVLPELSFLNAVGVIVVTYIVQGKFSIKVRLSIADWGWCNTKMLQILLV